jgi:hypothetical protein
VTPLLPRPVRCWHRQLHRTALQQQRVREIMSLCSQWCFLSRSLTASLAAQFLRLHNVHHWPLHSAAREAVATVAQPTVAELIRGTADAASLRHLLTTQLGGSITAQQAVASVTHLAHVCAPGNSCQDDSDLLQAILETLDAASCAELHGSDLASVLCSLSTWPTPLPASLLAPVVNELLRECQFLPKVYTISSSELAVLAVSLARQPNTADAQLWHQLVKALAVRSSQLQLSQLVDIVSLCVDLKKHTAEFMSAAAAAVIRQRDPLSPDQVCAPP